MTDRCTYATDKGTCDRRAVAEYRKDGKFAAFACTRHDVKARPYAEEHDFERVELVTA